MSTVEFQLLCVLISLAGLCITMYMALRNILDVLRDIWILLSDASGSKSVGD